MLKQDAIFFHCTTRRSWVVIVLFFVTFVFVSSPILIIPPAAPIEPVTVYVVDYGYHSGLILPAVNGTLVEYTYGDWQYFALNQQSWKNGIAALLLPTKGTLGRRRFSSVTEFNKKINQHRDVIILDFEVTQVKATQLLISLDKRFNIHLDTQVTNAVHQLTFVQDEQNYSLFHNSNHELTSWLKDLDCQVKGFVIWSNFQLKKTEN